MNNLDIINPDGEVIGYLQSISSGDDDRALIDMLTDWRNANRAGFYYQGPVTHETTRQFLQQFKDTSFAEFFVIHTHDGRPVGTIAYYIYEDDRTQGLRVAELGNLIRTREKGKPKLTQWAEWALVRWLFAARGVDRIFNEMFETNWAANSLHSHLGFEPLHIVPMRKVTHISYELAPDQFVAERTAIRLVLTREKYNEMREKFNFET